MMRMNLLPRINPSQPYQILPIIMLRKRLRLRRHRRSSQLPYQALCVGRLASASGSDPLNALLDRRYAQSCYIYDRKCGVASTAIGLVSRISFVNRDYTMQTRLYAIKEFCLRVMPVLR